MDEPLSPQLRQIKSRISAKSWRRRVERAKTEAALLDRVLAENQRGASLNQAIAKVLPEHRRSWAIHRLPDYRANGWQTLIDTRTPRDPRLSRACRQVLVAARTANPELSVDEALEILEKEKLPQPSPATIRREFRLVDGRRRYAQARARPVEIVELPFAGGELLLAAEQETGGIAALTQEVLAVAEWAREASAGQTPAKDTERRDRDGHFTKGYNRHRRRKSGERIAPYLRTAAEKAQGRVPSWPRFVQENADTIQAKLSMLTFGWLVAGDRGWSSLLAPELAGLRPLTGFAYRPSTLAKFVSALAISGASEELIDAVGRKWHEVARARWGEGGAMAAVYIDNHAKEVWTSLYTKSGRVAHRNKIMPCITETYAHTGAGTPMMLGVQSGSAPLPPHLVDLVEEAEAICGDGVARALVVDAEGSVFDVLASCQERRRAIVTPLRPSRSGELELHYSRGSYFRPFREGDELRIATGLLTHRSTGRTLDLGVLLVRRQHREKETVLLTTGLELGMAGRDLAALYFRRWPVQENAFREATILGINRHRGNCARIVQNVAVVTRLERLEMQATQGAATLTELDAQAVPLAQEAAQRERDGRRAQAKLVTRRKRLDALVAAERTQGRAFARVALEHQQALVIAEGTARATADARAVAATNVTRRANLGESLRQNADEQARLQPQRTIRQLDLDQDRILTATKLTAAQLISFALREYIPSASMTAHTFVKRVFPVCGRKEVRARDERIVFYENPRDADVNAALHEACARLNARQLVHEGRTVSYAVETPTEVEAARRRWAR